MDFFNPWYLLVAMVSSCIGLGAFLYGKRMQEPKSLVLGIVLMMLSYFVTDPLGLLAGTVILCGFLFSDSIQRQLQGKTERKLIR